jgi:membrane protein implicated in regulation of membrane protease activity
MSRSKSFARCLALGLAAAILAAVVVPAWGCPVCFGESDAPIVKGVEMSVLFLVIVTYGLLISGVAMVVFLRRRARRMTEDQQSQTNSRAPMAARS